VLGGVHEHVPRLDVAVDQAAPVRGIESVGHLARELERALGRERALLLEQGAQVAALDEAVREVELARRLARGVHGEDAGMVDRGGEPRLAQEALPERRVPGELRSDQLQRDRPVEGELGGAEHDAHPAPTEDAVDPVAGELGSDLGHV
jgi:hypothetical protein